MDFMAMLAAAANANAGAGAIGGSLEDAKPTQFSMGPWIFAQNPEKKEDSSADEIDEDTKSQITSMMFEELKNSGRQITPEDIVAIAKQVNDISGKWLIYRSAQTIDETWKKISKATVENKLGQAAKTSTAFQAMLKPGSMYVICVYTEDFTNEEDVRRVETALREIGIGGNMSYKPDIYTTLDIYAKNPWKLKPTVYTSKKPTAASTSDS